jgi:hypothetical protein
MTSTAQDTSMAKNVQRRRFELSVGGQVAAWIEYRETPGRIELVHTQVDSAHEGHGLGSALAKVALDRSTPRWPEGDADLQVRGEVRRAASGVWGLGSVVAVFVDLASRSAPRIAAGGTRRVLILCRSVLRTDFAALYPA